MSQEELLEMSESLYLSGPSMKTMRELLAVLKLLMKKPQPRRTVMRSGKVGSQGMRRQRAPERRRVRER